MSVWVVLPSARPVEQANAFIAKWHAQGYRVAMVRDFVDRIDANYTLFSVPQFGGYPGYAKAVNTLASHVFAMDSACDWVVATGDDTDPDPNKSADIISWECSYHFRYATDRRSETFGVMQPTGDPWRDPQGRIIERIAGSPWLGREWCRRANCGQGPLWPEFTHMFGDEHLQRYAQSLGVFWQRPDLTHFHNHAQRDQHSPPAPHMEQWNSPQHWAQSKAIFERLVAGNFKECAPIS
jgi:hypothetical protein